MNWKKVAAGGIEPGTGSARRRIRRHVATGLLCLAALLSAGVASAQDWRYRVRPGDTVWDLTGKYIRGDVAWQRLQAHNSIDDPYHLVPGSVMRFPVAWLKQQPAKAQVIGVHGSATVRNGLDGQTASITEGMQLGIGSTLRTAPDASLTLQFADGSRLLLQGGSELTLDKLSAYGATGMTDTRMRLPKGRTSSEVRPMRGPASHFIIETPNTMSSVRGTRFRIGSDGLHSQAEVTEGRVAVRGGGRQVMLEPGHGTVSGADNHPLEPTVLLPAPTSLSLSTESRPMQLQWAAVPGARQYRVQVGATPEFLALLHDSVVPDTRNLVAALPDGVYGIRVRAIDERGIEGRDAVIESRVVLPPPFAISPADGSSTGVERPRFRWTSMGDGVRYHLQLADASGFAQPLVDATDLKENDLRSPRALPPGDYRWRIAAIDRDGRASSFNDDLHFSVRAADAGPLAERSNGTDASDKRTLHVRWPAAENGQHFRFQLSRKADFSRLEVDREIDDHQIALPGLRAGTWHARVQSVDSDGYAGPFGPTQTFKLGCLACRIAAGGGVVLLLLAL